MKNSIYSLGILIILAALTSCKDQLTTNDATKVPASTFTESTAGLNQVLTSTYRAFLMDREAHGQTSATYQGVPGFMMLYDLMGSDCSVNKNYGSSPEPIYEFQPSRTQATGDANKIWDLMYNIINSANIIIASAPEAGGTDAEKNELIGQAKAIRAYCYFHLLLNYQQTYAVAQEKRGVILRLSPDDPVDLGFSTVAVCYNQVVQDLKDAESALSSFKRSERWQVDAVVAAGMLARVYQVMGNWEGAFTEASKVNAVYGNLMSEEQWCSGFDKLMENDCPELVWGVKYTQVSNISSNTIFNNWFNFDPSYGENMTTGPLYHFLCIFVDQTFVDLFADCPDDYRGTKCDKTEGVTDEDERGVMFWHRTANGDPKISSKWAYNKLKSYGDGTYEGHTNANHSYGIDAPLMRGSEMLLIMAEAKAHGATPAEALPYLNKLQNQRKGHVTTVTDKNALLEEIYVERRKELLGEGLTGSYDLLRLQKDLVRYEACATNPAGHFSWGMTEMDGYNGADAQPKGTIPSNDYRFLCQIPQLEIANNALVTEADQNPYKGQ